MTLAQLLNQNSYVVAALFLFVIISVLLWRVRRRRIQIVALMAAAMVLIALDFVFRVGVSEIQTTTQFDEILALHQPVVLEIYSNY